MFDKGSATCSSTHLTDFAILLNGSRENSDKSDDFTIAIISAIFVIVAVLLVLLAIIFLSWFPALRRLILEGQTPNQTKRKHAKVLARISQHTLQKYGIEQ